MLRFKNPIACEQSLKRLIISYVRLLSDTYRHTTHTSYGDLRPSHAKQRLRGLPKAVTSSVNLCGIAYLPPVYGIRTSIIDLELEKTTCIFTRQTYIYILFQSLCYSNSTLYNLLHAHSISQLNKFTDPISQLL